MLSLLLETTVKKLVERGLDLLLPKLGWRTRAPVPGWEARVERHCRDIRVHGIVEHQPRIEVVDRTILTDDQRAMRPEVEAEIELNDMHAMLVERPNLAHTRPTLRVAPLDYVDLEILRRSGERPPIVSGGALLVCPEQRSLILHHRSGSSRTYAGHLHNIGGAYMPPTTRLAPNDGHSLVATAQREVLEETQVAITIDDDPPMLIAEEPTTGFFQFILLGAPVSAKQAGAMRENWESEGIVKIPFDELEGWLLQPPIPWVPTGQGHVLAWLALGAPGAGPRPRFGALTPQQLFERVVRSRP